MHFLVGWEIKAVKAIQPTLVPGQQSVFGQISPIQSTLFPQDRWTQINESMKTVLKPYSWVRVLDNLYVVELLPGQESNWQFILQQFELVAKNCQNEIYFFMTPLFDKVAYNGWLQAGLWPEIYKRAGLGYLYDKQSK